MAPTLAQFTYSYHLECLHAAARGYFLKYLEGIEDAKLDHQAFVAYMDYGRDHIRNVRIEGNDEKHEAHVLMSFEVGQLEEFLKKYSELPREFKSLKPGEYTRQIQTMARPLPLLDLPVDSSGEKKVFNKLEPGKLYRAPNGNWYLASKYSSTEEEFSEYASVFAWLKGKQDEWEQYNENKQEMRENR